LAGLWTALMPLESRAQLQQQPQQQPKQQQLVIRFVRDPDPAPDIKAKDLNGKELRPGRIQRQSGTAKLLGHLVRAMPRGNPQPDPNSGGV
jgi:hypothetical protein